MGPREGTPQDTLCRQTAAGLTHSVAVLEGATEAAPRTETCRRLTAGEHHSSALGGLTTAEHLKDPTRILNSTTKGRQTSGTPMLMGHE